MVSAMQKKCFARGVSTATPEGSAGSSQTQGRGKRGKRSPPQTLPGRPADAPLQPSGCQVALSQCTRSPAKLGHPSSTRGTAGEATASHAGSAHVTPGIFHGLFFKGAFPKPFGAVTLQSRPVDQYNHS